MDNVTCGAPKLRSTGKSRLVLIGAVVAAVVGVTIPVLRSRGTGHVRIKDILGVYRTNTRAEYGGLTITYPLDGTLFPPEIVPPTVTWNDSSGHAEAWLVRVELGGGEAPIHVLCRKREWTPTSAQWESIKRQSQDDTARLVILGVRDSRPAQICSKGHLAMGTSGDPVDAPLFYREVNLPFIDAVKDPSLIRWRFGSIAAAPPPVVLENLPVCGNCHSFSQSGQTLAMDIDYANSKGSYVITPVKETVTLATSNVITWNDYQKEDGEQTFGLLSQISPDGRYVVSTVKDKSVFVPRPDLAFSQLFFPIRGILCIYDRQKGTFGALPGADDPSLVQSNPTWSPDGRTIIFARSDAYNLEHTEGQGKVLLTRAECKEFVEDGKPFLFDLYRIPFNAGRGGTPEPLAGASNNGMSNFFARYSPDGRWIVFCKAKSYMLLQPDSELYIIPAEGGTARRLCCNTCRMNSWHSFSPNGKWLVFASKAFSDYTQLCLTHIDAQGHTTPPVLLAHLTAPDRAANIPEFVNAPATAIAKIHEHFLNDYSFVRAGDEFFRHHEPDGAIAEYRKALELNDDNADAHHKLGFLLYHVRDVYEEGLAHLLKAATLAPGNASVHYDLGMTFLHQRRFQDAAQHFAEALHLAPDGIEGEHSAVKMHFRLGRTLLLAGQAEPAIAPLAGTVDLDPNHADAHYHLAVALADRGKLCDALHHYSRAIELKPEVDTSAILHHLLATGYRRTRQFDQALHHEERAYELARAAGDLTLAREIEKRVTLYRRIVQGQGH